MLNLDTHVLLHALSDDLTDRERALLSEDTWSISAIVLWEIAKLAQLGRIDVGLDDAELARAVARVHTWPLTIGVCAAIAQVDVHVDPADEIIAATSIVHDVPLVTNDRRLRRSRIIPLAR